MMHRRLPSWERSPKHVVSTDVEGRQKQCVCELAELEKLAEPEMYRLMIDLKIDTEAFVKDKTDLVATSYLA